MGERLKGLFQKKAIRNRPILSYTVILNLFQNPVEILRLSWIIRGAGGVTSDPHLTGSALLHPTENPQTQHDKMGRKCEKSFTQKKFPNSLKNFKNHAKIKE